MRAKQARGVCPGRRGGTPSSPTIKITPITHPNMLPSDILPPRTVSSRGIKRMLDRLQTDSPNQYTFKLIPPSLQRKGARKSEANFAGDARGAGETPNPDWSWLPKSALKSPTGLALLYAKPSQTSYQPRLAIAPPFPIQSETETTDRETLLQSIDPPLHVAIILIRYGYVAIAIAHDESIVLSKTDTRWVPNRHRAGGQSANRFKRSREKWAREFFDKSARLAAERFNTYPHHIDYLILGGDKHVINQFLQRANLPNNLAQRILPRTLNTLRPNRNALKQATHQTWSSTIYELAHPTTN